MEFQFAQRKVVASFGPGDTIAMCSAQIITDPNSSNGDCIEMSSKVQEFIQSSSLHHPVGRILVNASSRTFTTFQDLVRDGSSAASPKLFVKISLQYRTFLRQCAVNLENPEEYQRLIEGVNESTPDEDIESQMKLYSKLEFLWHLCEIVFLHKHQGGHALQLMIIWIKVHFNHWDVSYDHLVRAGINDDVTPLWDTMLGLLMQGEVEKIRKIFHLHPLISKEEFMIMDDLLAQMPLRNANYKTLSITDLNLVWQRWRAECQTRVQEGLFTIDDNLEFFAKVLSGDRKSFWHSWQLHLSDSCTWYEQLVGWLFLNAPFTHVSQLYAEAEKVLLHGGHNIGTGDLDDIMIAALQGNIIQIIHQLQSLLDTSWFAAHLTDLLFHSGCLESLNSASDPQVSVRLRESLLVDYADNLMSQSHSSVWQLGVIYLSHCATQGLQKIDLYLQTVPLTDESIARKTVELAREYNLTNTAQSICKVMARKFLKYKELGSALSWALRSEDAVLTTTVANEFLKIYVNTRTFPATEIIDTLGSSMLVSEKLTFLVKYREFHLLFQQKKLAEAATLLVLLLSANIAPKDFWMMLLEDAVPLLEDPQVLINSEQTYQILNCLGDIKSEITIPDNEDSMDCDHFMSSKEKEIRLALARNLARALVKENSIGN